MNTFNPFMFGYEAAKKQAEEKKSSGLSGKEDSQYKKLKKKKYV